MIEEDRRLIHLDKLRRGLDELDGTGVIAVPVSVPMTGYIPPPYDPPQTNETTKNPLSPLTITRAVP